MNMRYVIGLLITAGASFGIGYALRPAPEVVDGSQPVAPAASLVPAPMQSAADKQAVAEQMGALSDAESFVAKYLRNGEISAKAMERAMSELLAESDPIKMNQMMAELLGQLTPENAPVAMQALQGNVSRDPSQFYLSALFANAWGRIDGEKALDYMKDADGMLGRMGSASALSGWALDEPDQAMAWLESQEDTPQKMIYTAGLINGLAKSDPSSATEYLLSVPENNQMRSRYIDIIANEQMKKGIDEATRWADGLSDASLKGDAFTDLATRYTQQDPEQAGRWIEDRATEPWAQDAVREVADEWAELDPAAAVEWAGGLPEQSQGDAMAAAFEEWTESDPTTASTYLAEMPDSPTKDHAIVGFTERLVREDPEAAMTWASTINNADLRTEALTDAGQAWYRQDQEAASAWLSTSDLPADVQEKVTAPPSRERNFMDAFRGFRN